MVHKKEVQKLKKNSNGDEEVEFLVKTTVERLSGRMDERTRAMIVVFLFCVFAGVPAEGQPLLDVCATCHANATCDNKSDGSGKVCNCKYGFVGNGRTFCQDKDECLIGAKLCGQHTTCHNTYGSYYCTCLAGYSPSNNMAVFIPNDGTHCQDIDECRITGLCGDGGQCRNIEGSFDCSCMVGYKVHNGAEPFHPMRDKASCKVVDCGPPVSVEDTVLLSVTGTTYSSVVMFGCDEGFVWRTGDNSSVCGADGLWRGPTLVCEAKCGPVPLIANSEVVWHNRSVVIHRCVVGYHSWRGNYVSVCGSSGAWQKATLTCIEIKPPINHLFIFNENCLRWKAEKYEEDTEVYRVTYTGSRDYQKSFHDKRKRFLSSKADQLELCLNLLPVTNYSISITATLARFTASITTNTSLPVPLAPVIYYREFETPLPTLRLRRSPSTLDPISFYQVFVLPVEEIMMFDCSSPVSLDGSSKIKSPSEYITAQFDVQHVGTDMNFTVGDGFLYGGVYNTPLQSGNNYYIILRTVSQWRTALKSSCILWAKVRGTSYVLKISSLAATALIGLFAVVLLGTYSFTWYWKKNKALLSADVL